MEDQYSSKTNRQELKSRPSGCITSESSASDSEPSPSLLRRGRRKAVIETSKDCGDMSPHNLTEEDLSSNSNDEGDTRKPSKQSRRMHRRRSSGGTEMCQEKEMVPLARQRKVLIRSMTASDIYAPRSASTLSLLEDGNKRNKKSMKKKTKGKVRATSFDESLRDMKPSVFKDNHLIIYKNLHWSDLIARKEQDVKPVDVPETERMRREAVWELFKSECVFLVDHLMVLKHVFLEPLKKIQVDGHVMAAEPEEIFGNLDELGYSIYAFCKEFLQMLLKDAGPKTFGETQTLIRAFKRLSALTKDAEIYHTYCLNYMNAIVYLEKLQNDEEFLTFQKWAEQDRRCNRLKLPDLLVAPMQHCTKLPLLLNQIRKYTTDTQERLQLEESIEKVELSLQELDGKMKWVKNVERIQEINSQVVWPSVTDIDPKAFIPESLKARLHSQPCDQILSSLDRQVIHESHLTLVENSKVLDIYLFLFDDMLLITKMKKSARKKYMANDFPPGTNDKGSYVVYRQPIPLDRLSVYDTKSEDEQSNGLKNAFVVVHINRFKQVIGLFTFQSLDESVKTLWISKLQEAVESYRQNKLSTKASPSSPTTEATVTNRENGVSNPGSSSKDHSQTLTMKNDPATGTIYI